MGLSRWDNPRGAFFGRNRWYSKLLKLTFINLMAHIGRVPTTKQIASSKIDISLGCHKKSSKDSFDE